MLKISQVSIESEIMIFKINFALAQSTKSSFVSTCAHTRDVPRSLATRDGRPAPPRPAPQKSKSCPALPRENWQNLRGGAGQSLFEN